MKYKDNSKKGQLPNIHHKTKVIKRNGNVKDYMGSTHMFGGEREVGEIERERERDRDRERERDRQTQREQSMEDFHSIETLDRLSVRIQ